VRDVGSWHLTDKQIRQSNGRYWGHSGQSWSLACVGYDAIDPEQTWGTMAYCRGKSIIAKTIRKSGPSFAWGEFW